MNEGSLLPCPRLEIHLAKLSHNAATLITRLNKKGIAVTAVTKATLGMPEIAAMWLQAGAAGLGDARIENIRSMRNSEHLNLRNQSLMSLIRTPMLSQVAQVVQYADISLNTEISVLTRLSKEAQKINRHHGVILMVELGDLREGILPEQLESVVRHSLCLPNIRFLGIGANLACRSGVAPDQRNMDQLSELANLLDKTFGTIVKVVSAGNSANLNWALDSMDLGRVNHLRLGEALLLGCEPLQRERVEGLHTDAFTLVAEVIEVGIKPAKPWGCIAQTAFGEAKSNKVKGKITQAILAIGRQDTDHEGLLAPEGVEILSASSDHLVISISKRHPPIHVGETVSFQLNYSALLQSMTSPFVSRVF